MKKLKRSFLKDGEKINFGVRQGSNVQRYFDTTRYSFRNSFFLYIDFTIPPIPKNLNITLIYRDNNNVEYFIQHKITIPPNNIKDKDHEIKFQIILFQENKKLYKIVFECLPVVDSSIIVSLSEM